MGFDLTDKNISDTFQNLIQTTGSSAYNLVGQEITTFGVSGSFATSTSGGTKMLNGSQVSGSISVANKTNGDSAFVELSDVITIPEVASNKLHSRNGHLYWGSTLLAGEGTITGITSLSEDDNPTLGADLNLFTNTITGSGNIDIDGTIESSQLILKENSSPPSVEIGGMYYDSTTGEFYLGKND